jgi:hypothetical protein
VGLFRETSIVNRECMSLNARLVKRMFEANVS